MERMEKVEMVVVDKTGTLTEGKTRLTNILPATSISQEALLTAAAAVEAHSEHPLATAVVAGAAERGIKLESVANFASINWRQHQRRSRWAAGAPRQSAFIESAKRK